MLKRSSDRKVTNAVTASGNVAIRNTFGIPSGKSFSCPGATSFCESICYAGKLEKMYPSARKLLVHNFEELLYADYLDGKNGMVNLIVSMLWEFHAECEKRNAPKVFRIHWDGDFFSRDYAKAWAYAIRYFNDIDFWVYTRSFTDDCFVIDILAGIDNLSLYLSADPVNIDLANKVASEYPGVFIATVADTFAMARDTIVNTMRKVYDCPENGKRIPLISEKGSACVRCGICISGRGDVTFAVQKK